MASRNHLAVSKLYPQEQDLQKTLFPTSHRFRHRSPALRRKHQMIELLNADFFDSKTYQNISLNSMSYFGFFRVFDIEIYVRCTSHLSGLIYS